MKFRLFKRFLPLLCLLFWGESLLAVQPRKWVSATRDEFLKGKLRGVSVTSDARLIIAPALETLLNTEEPFVYSAAADGLGNVYLGTGNDGKLFRITANGESKEWAKLDEPGVYAMALDSAGRVYAGTAPDGKVYRLDLTGRAEVFFDPDEKYIWSLAIDRRDNVYVGTGSRGIVYKVGSGGEGRKFYDSPATHIVSLAWDLDRNILAGTSARALILRLSSEGAATVLHDSPLEEVRSIAVDRYGNIFAAALSGGARAVSLKTESTAKTTAKTGARPAPSATSGRTVRVSGTTSGKRLEIYRIGRSGGVETLYSSDRALAYDLLIRNDGNLLVATGDKGRIFSVSPKRFVTLLVESGEEQVTRLLERRGRLFAATSNLGKGFELKTKPSEKGVYESRVFDAGMVASWGNIQWEVIDGVEPAVKASVRTGNTDTPDDTWGKWSPLYSDSSGTRIESPPTRYLQWKLEFPAEGRSEAVVSQTNAVDLVTVSYLQHNMAPLLSSITVHPPGAAFVRYASTDPAGGVSPAGPGGAHRRSLPPEIRRLGSPTVKTPPRRVYLPGAQSLSWSAQDPNGDDLVYSIHYRTAGDRRWTLLEKDLTETYRTLDGKSLPDGTYVVRVTVSDSPSNPADRALESELMSKPFVVANSAPEIKWGAPRVEGSEARIQVEVRTVASAIHQLEYAVDGGDWRLIFPEDGIADGTVESYRLKIDGLNRGEHLVTVRVVDSVGNLGSGRLTLAIP
ncbi:MAG: hypothetical protein OXH11_06390 [Candidatus Aminicenantes bacterium]|nr:hypothetical protein [Candidatus Aminicenantes bacterium]